MPEEYTPQEVMEAVKALHTSVDKYGEKAAGFKEVEEKVQKILDEQEERNQKKQLEIANYEKEKKELEERVKGMELEITRLTSSPHASKTDYKKSDEYKALTYYVKNGFEKMSVDFKDLLEEKTMRTDDNTQGGYLTTVEMENEIIKEIIEQSPVRSLATVRTVGSKTVEIPTRTGIPTATYEGETEEGPTNNSEYGLESLTTYALTNSIAFTRDQLMDSQFDLMTEIRSDNAEAFARGESRGFILGTGAKQPEGILTDSRLIAAASETDAVGVIGFDDMTLLTGEIKTGYNPYYFFNRRTLAKLRIIKDNEGRPLWQAGLGDAAPNAINGEPYVLFEDMPDIAANTLAVGYGDITKGYRIVDRTGMEMIRDEITLKKKRIIELTFWRYNTGQVVLAEAFRLLKVKAA